ncbi:MAG: hypothetical protein QNJ54_06645 [Prochloraceae cyanobacterium]|nr:hypothetical protein [Prochloraceae cyanobacterium]
MKLPKVKVGNKFSIPCLDDDCKGKLKGIYGGDIYVGKTLIKYSQLINSQCDICHKEVYEVRLRKEEEYCREEMEWVEDWSRAVFDEYCIYPVNQLANRFKIKQLELYRRLYALGIKLINKSQYSYINYESLWVLDGLENWLKRGNKMTDYAPLTYGKGIIVLKEVDDSLDLKTLKKLVSMDGSAV